MGRDSKLNPRARDFAGAPPPPVNLIRDGRGRVLQVGDEIIVSNAATIGLIVQAIEPILDPRFPAGHVRVTVSTVQDLVLPAGQVVPNLLRIRTREELQQIVQERKDADGNQREAEGEAPTTETEATGAPTAPARPRLVGPDGRPVGD